MSEALRRAGLFALTVCLFLIFADIALWGFYQGAHPRDELVSQLLVRALLHSSVLVLCALGAVVAFYLVRNRLPSGLAVSLSAVAFGVASLFVFMLAFANGGPLLVAIWLVAGSAAAAALAALFVGNRHVG